MNMELRDEWKRIQSMPYVGILLIACNVILFMICTFTGQLLYNKGGLSPALCLDMKQYYRLIVAMFLHADIEHLINNMLLLGGLGAMLEPEIGHGSFCVLYFAGGLGGQIASLLYKACAGEWYVVSIGASGAVYGLVGVLLAMSLCRYRKMPTVTWQKVIIVVVFTIYSGLRTTNIDNAAHAGGFVTGTAAGLVVCLLNKLIKKSNRKDIPQEEWSRRDEY